MQWEEQGEERWKKELKLNEKKCTWFPIDSTLSMRQKSGSECLQVIFSDCTP